MTDTSLQSQFRRALIGSTGIYLFGSVMGFLVGIQLARGLGVAGYGFYGSAMAAASLGATVAAGGLQLQVTREVAASRARNEPEAASRLVRWSIRNVFILGAAASLTVGGYVLWGQRASQPLALWAMASTILMSLLWLVGAIVRGTGAVVLGQALDVAIRPTVQSGLLLIALLAFGTINPGMALALSCLAIIVALPFSWPTISRVWTNSGASIDDEERRAWRRASATIGLTTIVRAAEAALPLIVIGAVSTMEEAGLYRVSSAVAVVLSMPASMISVMIPPMVASLYELGEMVRLKRLATISGLAIVLPTLMLAVILWFHGETLLGLAFGSDFRAGWSSLVILAGSTVIWSLSGISVSLLHAARLDAVVSRAFWLSLAVTGMGVLFAAWDGRAEAIAVAVLIGTCARTVFLVVDAWRLVGIDPSIVSAFQMLTQYRWRD